MKRLIAAILIVSVLAVGCATLQCATGTCRIDYGAEQNLQGCTIDLK